jgi:hypothetical protein
MTQRQVGNVIGVKKSFICQVEKGHKRLRYSAIRMLERFFRGVKPGELFLLLQQPEFDWLSTFAPGDANDPLATANPQEKDELRKFLAYLRFSQRFTDVPTAGGMREHR